MASVPRIESPGQRLESLGTPPLKLSDAEEENLEEAARRKPWMWSRVGGGSDVRGLYKPQDYGINRRRTNGKRQSSRFLPSGAKGFEAFADWPRGLRQEMKTINALNLQPAVPLASIKLEIRRKSYQPRRVACDAMGRT